MPVAVRNDLLEQLNALTVEEAPARVTTAMNKCGIVDLDKDRKQELLESDSWKLFESYLFAFWRKLCVLYSEAKKSADFYHAAGRLAGMYHCMAMI